MFRKRKRVLRPFVDRLNERCLLSGFGTLPTGLTPAQITQAYALDDITFTANGQTVKGNGSGQTIALIEAYHDPDLSSDLHTFDQAYGLPDPSLTQIDQAGNQANDGWAGEEAMDVEWAHAIAPGANIVVVEAKTDSTPALMSAVATARALPGVSVISMSWGGSESPTETSFDSEFTTPAGHIGITFVAAAGDDGAIGGAQWPASSPNVLAVGGTTLQVDAEGDYLGETAWIDSSSGQSLYESLPSYQAVAGLTGTRSTPDVDFDADPNTGVEVYATAPSTGQGSWQVEGGTSLGAPAWSAIIAIADQGRATVGLGSLNGPTQTLPGLYSLPSTDFHAVSAAVPVFGGSGSFPGYGAGGGFRGRGFFEQARTDASQTVVNASTGLGSPNGSALIDDLAFKVAPASTTETAKSSRKEVKVRTPHTTKHPLKTKSHASLADR